MPALAPEQNIELLMTEDMLFAELGRLYMKNQMLHQQVIRTRMELAAAKLPQDGVDDVAVPGVGDDQ